MTGYKQTIGNHCGFTNGKSVKLGPDKSFGNLREKEVDSRK